MVEAKSFDAAEYLDSPEMIAAYLNEALECEDASAIAIAIGTVARARGMGAAETVENDPKLPKAKR
jgi:probable addiction module antidote protein